MIPIIRSGLSSLTDVQTNASGRRYGPIPDCISCHVVEERNGNFYLELEYPVGGANWERLTVGNLIQATPSDGGNDQLFRVVKIRPTIAGRMAVTANHITADCKYMAVKPFTITSNAGGVLQKISQNIVDRDYFKFTFSWKDAAVTAKYSHKIPVTLSEALMGASGAVTDVFPGGEYAYEDYGFKIKYCAAGRGETKKIGVRYGINMTDLSLENAVGEMYNRVYGYYYDSESGYYLAPVGARGLNNPADGTDKFPGFGVHRVKIVDFTNEFDDPPTDGTDISNKAQAYAERNGGIAPGTSLKVNLAALWQSTDGGTVEERIQLCDTIPIVYPKLGLSITGKVVKTDYDVLTERYRSIEIGTIKKPLGKILAQTAKGAGVSVYT